MELGAPLFERRGRNITLSRFGRVFAEHIGVALHELDQGITRVRELSDPEKGQIDISLTYAIANIYFPKILQEYAKKVDLSKLHFQFRQVNTPNVLDHIQEGVSEIGFCAHMEDRPEIRFYPLMQCPLCLAVPQGHPLAERRSVVLEEVASYPLILSVDQTHYTEELLQSKGLNPIVVCRMGEDRSIANLVASGLGVAILPYDPQLSVCGVRLVAIEGASREFYMVVSKTRMLSSAAKCFVEFIQSSSGLNE